LLTENKLFLLGAVLFALSLITDFTSTMHYSFPTNYTTTPKFSPSHHTTTHTLTCTSFQKKKERNLNLHHPAIPTQFFLWMSKIAS